MGTKHRVIIETKDKAVVGEVASILLHRARIIRKKAEEVAVHGHHYDGFLEDCEAWATERERVALQIDHELWPKVKWAPKP